MIRERVEALLAAEAQPETLMATKVETVRPTIKLDLADAPDRAVGQTFRRYKLLEPTGEGGCGMVYVAEPKEPVQRRVAYQAEMRQREAGALFQRQRHPPARAGREVKTGSTRRMTSP